jgi:hypothetical protein
MGNCRFLKNIYAKHLTANDAARVDDEAQRQDDDDDNDE